MGRAAMVITIEKVYGRTGDIIISYTDDGSWTSEHGLLGFSLQVPAAFLAEHIAANQELECTRFSPQF
jgi:hypothetical protein